MRLFEKSQNYKGTAMAPALETRVVGELPAELLEILAKGRNPEGVD